jgi:hypothetical protein
MIILLLACHPRPECPAGETRRNGSCWGYEAGQPVSAVVWEPTVGTTWQVQYTGELDRSVPVDVFDVDLFDTDEATIDLLRANGHHVLCYFSAGSFEEWRPDAPRFPQWALGNPLEGWEGEWWVDYTAGIIVDIMRDRIALAGQKGCNGVDPDNVDAFANDNGLNLTATMQLDYNRFLADTARNNGLSVVLKNDVGQLAELEPWFDMAVNEECITYDECDGYTAFTGVDKPVFHIEYVDAWTDAPAKAEEVCGRGPELDTLIKTWDLGPEFLACPVTGGG